MNEYTPLTGENDWKIVRNAATSSNFVTPQEFDRWLESVKAVERNDALDKEWITTPDELLQHVLAGRNAERERIEDIIDNEYADLVAAGHLNSEAMVVLGRILDRIGGEE